MRRIKLSVLSLGLVFLAALHVCGAPPNSLSVIKAGGTTSHGGDDPAVSRTRVVPDDGIKLNALTELQEGAGLVFEFFPDAAYTVTVSKVTAGYGEALLIDAAGAQKDALRCSAVFAPDGLRYEVYDAQRGMLYLGVTQPDGSLLIREFDDTRRLPKRYLPPIVIPEDEAAALATNHVSHIKQSGTTIIDLMMVFDTTAKTWALANGGVATIANSAVNRLNAALTNSGVDAMFRLTYIWEAGYVYSGDMSTDLSALRNNTGALSSSGSFRDTYGADIVSMMVDTGSAYGWVGVGYLPGSSAGSSSAAFSVCSVRSVNISHTMSHEIGHNLGCHHSKTQADSPGPGVYTYAAGWYFTGNNSVKYHTIMAYDSDGYGNSYSECDFFSTPNKTYQGVAVGHATNGDNARTITNMKGVIAAYRAETFNVVAPPQFNPVSGTSFASSLTVTMTCGTAGATIRYTTNGSEPTSSSTLYSSALTITATTTIKAKAFKAGMSDSVTVTANYIKTAANDNFSNAIAISGISGTTAGHNIGATKETGEPDHASSGGASVWWKWTAPGTGSVVFHTYGSDFDTMMAAYTGTGVAALTKLAENDDYDLSGGVYTSQISFTATSGTTYYIAVDGWDGDNGSITLSWAQTVVAPAAPTGLTASSGTSTANVALSWTAASGATAYEVWRHTANASASAAKLGDPTGTSFNDTTAVPGTLYYYWVKAKNAGGTSAFSTVASGYRALAVPGGVAATDNLYEKVRVTWSAVTGATHYRVARATSSGGTKIDLGSWQSATAFDDATAVSGTTYYYWVRAAVNASGLRASSYSAYDAGVRLLEGPVNNMFASAISLSGATGFTTGNNLNATKESGEPDHHGYASATASVWWKWIAPSDGQVIFDTIGSSFDTVLAVYTGASVGALAVVASNDDALGTASRVIFNTSAGTVYRVAVAGYNGLTGNITLNWSFTAPEGPTIVTSEIMKINSQRYFRIYFKGKSGKTYLVQKTATLTSPNQWQPLSPPVSKTAAYDGVHSLDVPVLISEPSGFYRVIQQQ